MLRIHPAGTLLVIAVIGMLFFHDCSFQKRERAGRELANGGQAVSVAASEADLEAMASGRRADTFETRAGTKIRVVRPGPATSQVELLTGPSAGKVGYVPTEWIK